MQTKYQSQQIINKQYGVMQNQGGIVYHKIILQLKDLSKNKAHI